MIVAALIASILVFVAVLRIFDAAGAGERALTTARSAAVSLRDTTLTDEEKERVSRKAAAGLFRGFLATLLIGGAAIAASALLLWVGAAVGLYSWGELLATAMGWPFLIASLVIGTLAWFVAERLGRNVGRGGAVRARGATLYGALDRAMHRLGFRTLGLQRRLAAAETSMFRDRLDPEHARRPVFVTSLPRAGTTVVLEALSRLPEFASATYRHMPFPLLPLLWSDASRSFRREATLGERAHGDGLDVGFDSPEAFEEPLWMAHWPRHYSATAIRPWQADERDPGFERAFRQHMAKIVAAGPEGGTRYLSKNNANIARLPLISAIFRDATIVVPVRDPLAHAASLLRQHRRFLALHAEDPFARTYMEGLGHFEFGAALRPIGFATPADPAEADDPAFWLSYWCDAYEAILRDAGPGTIFVSLERLSSDPLRQLAELAAAVGATADSEAISQAAQVFRPQSGRAPEGLEVPPALAERARRLYRALLDRCIGVGEVAA